MKNTNNIAVPKEITDFYKALHEIGEKNLQRFPRIELTTEQKEQFEEQKVPLLSLIGFSPARDKVNAIFAEVYEVVFQQRPRLKDELEKIKAELNVTNKDLRPLLEDFLWQNDRGIRERLGKKNLNGEILSLLLFHVAKPLVHEISERLTGQVSYDKWYRNICPVCGWKAAMATSSVDSGQRILHCSLCDTSWSFRNLECPHCSNQDHDTLKYLSIEDDEIYKINVCEKCKGYIKTMDESKVVARNSILEEDARTIHLDIIAEQAGYQKDDSSDLR